MKKNAQEQTNISDHAWQWATNYNFKIQNAENNRSK